MVCTLNPLDPGKLPTDLPPSDTLEAPETLEAIVAKTSDINLLKEVRTILYDSLQLLENKTMAELEVLHKRHADVEQLQELRQLINDCRNSKGEIDFKNNPRGVELLQKAKQLGVKFDDKKVSFSKEQTENLVDAIETKIGNLNLEYELQMQTVTRLTNLRYEFIQLARLIEKRIDELMTKLARGIQGG